MSEPLITCNQCGNQVPRLKFCIRCGDPLTDEYAAESVREDRRRFAAAPQERLNSVAFISTFFPQLPRADMRTFRLAFAAGVAIVVALALLGFYPIALVSAAAFVPLLFVLYLWDVDIYEDEPIGVIGATMLWGALAGVAFAWLVNGLPAPSGFGPSEISDTLISGVGVPLLEGVLMIAGPLVLLRWRRFNDVLDGATFGAASAVSFSGAHLIVQSLPIFSAGLRPAGDPLPWVIQLLSLGVLQPVIAAGAIGALAAAIWLRYRAPVNDRNALGLVGQPAFAALGAAVLLVASGLAKTLLTLIPQTVVLAIIAVIALLWLRRALHLGLLQESREIEVEGEIRCPNCGLMTAEHTFCGQCGISLRAVPSSRRAKAD
ncbi:MAG TPA: PrsW family glutamic-type intramembrane protease [Candidatus Limnocylindria bacterium]|nr:PrsW family glutamic-type intramembrane protease [Candidatus Limnocylindria bacterium]